MRASGICFFRMLAATVATMPSGLIMEVAVDSLERAMAAERAGAHRLELCANLETGGLTPSLDLMRRVKAAVRIPVHAMVRPRSGDFVYSGDEFTEMKASIKAIKSERLQGIVTGVLLPAGLVDGDRTRELVKIASPMQVTFHRAFDEAKDLGAALEEIVAAGAHRILTSGGAPDASEGAATLRLLIQQAGNRLTILPGGGLHPGNIGQLAHATGARELHTGLGGVIPYTSQDIKIFESAVRDCLAALAM
jgi:copper homeostasis protein